MEGRKSIPNRRISQCKGFYVGTLDIPECRPSSSSCLQARQDEDLCVLCADDIQSASKTAQFILGIHCFNGTPLLVRRSSDPAPGPPADAQPSASHPSGQSLKPVILDSTQNLEDGEVMNGVQTEPLTSPKTKDALSDMTRTVEISGEGGPLGIHVVPFFSSLSGRILGLFIRGIEENSRSKREGLFHENECIVKINSVDLVDKTFAQ
ncbi:partitioning defective 3 homolog B-like [Leptonychotes weddellii]|uniref:Partitioning defective 3 homolog B-like n=1 Tax=Leptonychotes weddellii TaxID=9713 RepID=A0A7F8Q497_LEPWE|nr:partitioning defective 3 homolog B-like [Leptonychotes weddellii]